MQNARTTRRKSQPLAHKKPANRKKQAKRKGLRPGARNSAETQEQKNQSVKNKDARVGSRKPVALVAEAPVAVVKAPKPAAPKAEPQMPPEQQLAKWERELEKLENDDRLNALLDKLELEQPISEEDQEWLDKNWPVIRNC